ncbi:MAG TPA: undecaprenyl-phosphate glucose phosphotransferase [Gemmataceae bacterium]
MFKRRGQTLCAWFYFSDVALAAAAWVGAYYVRFFTGWIPVTKPMPDFWLCLRSLPLVVALAVVSFRIAGQYEVHRLRRFREELVAVFKGVALLSLFVMASSFYSHDPYESRGAMVLFSAMAFVALLLNRRLGWWLVHHLRRQGYNPSYALIVGTGRVARKTARALRRASWMGIRTVGFVEDRPSRWTSDLHILGTTADLPRLIERYRIGHVFIALPMNRYHEARHVFDVLSQHLVEVRLVADVPDLAGLSLTTTNLDGLPVIGLRESPHFGLNVLVKRVMDVLIAGAALVALAPLMLLIALLVKLTSRGPVFYKQERCGLNGEPFRMLKFRTMRADAEKDGPKMTAVNDDRRTPLGAFLRRTSLDELPQLINVLKGDMSLVGPRPERPVFIQKFRKTIPNYMARHAVKAGITGWAQVHGWRGNTSLRKRLQFDLYYITHWNPWLDIRILWMTLWKVLSHRHAY